MALSETHIKEREPILNRLQSKTTQDESDAECPQPSLWKVVRIVFDIGIDGGPDPGDNARHQSHADRKRPNVVHISDQCATDERRANVADRADHRSPKLPARKARASRRHIVERGTHPARIAEYLADGYQYRKSDGEFEADGPVEPGSETNSPDRGEESFPRQVVVV